ncbi:MAG: UDP-2,4-diacetamido-2,4,6-trideoxy-beta-L-altropyranose hydrolase [Alistipes sp.]|nr:UDP-2,4-diacetamido-2,4,6-trideoxy-beta-L-altropyranose hydrolase [Alistipes sp.]
MDVKRKIFFRADASATIGYGHFVRTLALADMLKDDFDCTFFTQTPTDYQIAEVDKVCKLVALPADDSKFDVFLDYLIGEEIVVLDNYFFTTDYQRQIKARGCKLVCIDDIHDKHYVADIVINHAIGDKSVFSVEPYTQLCLGLEWSLLRKPFLQPMNFDNKESGHWFIAFGGSDYHNLTQKYVDLIQSNDAVKKISVVVGDAYKYRDTLKGCEKVNIYSNLSAADMAILMQRCEYAIVPCSSICIEAISQRCKIFAGYYVDNQVEFYYKLLEDNYIEPLGNLVTNDLNFLSISKTYQAPKIQVHNIENNIRNLFRSL